MIGAWATRSRGSMRRLRDALDAIAGAPGRRARRPSGANTPSRAGRLPQRPDRDAGLGLPRLAEGEIKISALDIKAPQI